MAIFVRSKKDSFCTCVIGCESLSSVGAYSESQRSACAVGGGTRSERLGVHELVYSLRAVSRPGFPRTGLGGSGDRREGSMVEISIPLLSSIDDGPLVEAAYARRLPEFLAIPSSAVIKVNCDLVLPRTLVDGRARRLSDGHHASRSTHVCTRGVMRIGGGRADGVRGPCRRRRRPEGWLGRRRARRVFVFCVRCCGWRCGRRGRCREASRRRLRGGLRWRRR